MQKISRLTAWQLPESQGWPKKGQKLTNLTKYNAFYIERDLKSKNARGKKFIFKPRMSLKKENLNQSQKNIQLKFCGAP